VSRTSRETFPNDAGLNVTMKIKMEKTTMRKIVLTVIALSTLGASAAVAAPSRHHPVRPDQTVAAPRGAAVINEGTVIGQDPDAYVRYEILRSAGSENQG
jgi:hypothetical protein